MFGNLLGGALNDLAARLAPTHGRVLVGQLSVFSGLPIFLLLFYGSAPRAAAPLMLLAGLLVSWCGGVNNSMMAEVVDPALRTTIYGLDRALEGVVAPVGGLAAGWIAEEFFGFAQSDGGACGGGSGGGGGGGNASSSSSSSSSLHDGGAEDAGNAKALGDALAVTMLVPWGFCFLAYSLLHCTYGRDKRKTEAALAAAQAAADGGGGGTLSDSKASDRSAPAGSAAGGAPAGGIELRGLRAHDAARRSWSEVDVPARERRTVGVVV